MKDLHHAKIVKLCIMKYPHIFMGMSTGLVSINKLSVGKSVDNVDNSQLTAGLIHIIHTKTQENCGLVFCNFALNAGVIIGHP